MTNSVQNEKENQAPRKYPQAVVMQMVSGLGFSMAVKTAVDLGVFSALKDGRASVETLAESLKLNPSALSRLLRALESVGLVVQEEDCYFDVTEYGATLIPGKTPKSIKPLVDYLLHETVVQSMFKMDYSIRTGKSSFEEIYGEKWYENDQLDKEYLKTMNKAMEIYSKMSLPALLASYSFEPYDVIVDVAGGMGQLLTGILSSAPESKGILFDLPKTIESAKEYLASAEVSERCNFIGGSMFDEIPSGGSLYVISKVLNDWDDEHVVSILRNISNVMSDNAKLIIIENVPDAGRLSPEEAFRDLLFLVCSAGGRVRKKKDFENLIAKVGLTLKNVIQTPSKFSIIECEKKNN
ncbi:methyltransferase [Bacillus spizizenii]|nr:methyltransferase [Bacillus spizizenii]